MLERLIVKKAKSLNNIQAKVANIPLDKYLIEYSFKDLVWEILFLHKFKCRSKIFERMNLRNTLFKEGVKDFNHSLSCEAIIASIKELQTSVQLLKLKISEDSINYASLRKSRSNSSPKMIFQSSTQIDEE